MSKLLDQLITETGIELHSSRYDVAAAMIERELQAKWDAGYEAAKAQHLDAAHEKLAGDYGHVISQAVATAWPPTPEQDAAYVARPLTHVEPLTAAELDAMRGAPMPSAADLDAVADEQLAAQQTSEPRVCACGDAEQHVAGPDCGDPDSKPSVN